VPPRRAFRWRGGMRPAEKARLSAARWGQFNSMPARKSQASPPLWRALVLTTDPGRPSLTPERDICFIDIIGHCLVEGTCLP